MPAVKGLASNLIHAAIENSSLAAFNPRLASCKFNFRYEASCLLKYTLPSDMPPSAFSVTPLPVFTAATSDPSA